MRKRIVILLLAATIVAYPALALGADGKSASAELLSWILSLLAAIVLVLIQRAIDKWLKPRVSKETAKLIDQIACMSVRYAEERGRAALKENGQRIASNVKLEHAAELLLVEADRFGVKDMDMDRARKYVESALSRMRNDAAATPQSQPPVPLDTGGKVRRV